MILDICAKNPYFYTMNTGKKKPVTIQILQFMPSNMSDKAFFEHYRIECYGRKFATKKTFTKFIFSKCNKINQIAAQEYLFNPDGLRLRSVLRIGFNHNLIIKKVYK